MRLQLSIFPKIDYSDILDAVFSLMLRSGIEPEELTPMCARSFKRAKVRSHQAVNDTGELAKAAQILDAWHRDRRYLSVDGIPKSVRLLGRAPSVEALARAHGRRKPAPQIARRLKELHLVVPCGRGHYKPSSDVAVLPGDNPLVLQHAARALSTFVQTIAQNAGTGRAVSPLIERIAEVPDLPRRHVADFQQFTQLQGRIFLRTVNDWLEMRRASRLSKKQPVRTVRAGIHTYAYVASKKRGISAL